MVATSARALCQALRAAGWTVDVLDAFGDQDTRAAARHCTVLPWSATDDPAPQAAAVLHAVEAWSHSHPAGVLVAGSGFEHRPTLLDALAARHPLAGNPGSVVARCKDPWQLAARCQALGLHSPALRRPDTDLAVLEALGGRWLSRQIGGCGGSHLRAPAAEDAAAGDRVWQQWCPGEPVSVLLYRDAQQCRVLSLQSQFCAPAPQQAWRFGGVVAVHQAPWTGALGAAGEALAQAFDLRGLNGIDALWDGERLWVLEINPRPPASLQLLPARWQSGWAARHALTAQSTAGRAPGPAPGRDPDMRHALKAGMAVVYASSRLSIPADFRFPPGCHDLPVLPRSFGPGDPVCSVQARSGGIEKLRTLIGVLRERLLPLAGADVLSSL